MGKPNLLDAIILLDYRFVLVLVVTAVLYYRPSVCLRSSLLAPGSGHGGSWRNRSYSVTTPYGNRFDAVRLANAMVCAGLAWLAAGLLPLLIQSIHWPLILDAPLMHYIAWRITNGAVPYRDIFDMNFPGVYVIHIAVLKVFGASDTGWRLFDFLWLALTDLLLWRFCFPVGRWWACAAVLFYSAFHLSSGAISMGQRDYLDFTFLLGGLMLAVHAFDRGVDRRYLALAGVVFGCAMSIKPMAGLLWIAMAVLAGLQAHHATKTPRRMPDERDARKTPWALSDERGARKTAWRTPAAVLAGGLVVPAALLIWLAVTGGLRPFLIILAGVLPLYSKMHARPFVSCLVDYWPILVSCVLTVPAALLNGRPNVRVTALILGVCYGVLHFWLQGKGFLYHLYPLVGFSSALLACTVATAQKAHGRARVLAVSGLIVFFTVAFGLWDARLQPALAMTAAATDSVASLQKDITPRLGPDVTVQSFDTAGGCVHSFLRMKIALPTQYLCDFLFFVQTDQPYVRQIHAQLMTELKRRPPTYLVVYRPGWPSGQLERIDRFPELRHYMDANYRVAVLRPQYVLYERRTLPPQDISRANDGRNVSR